MLIQLEIKLDKKILDWLIISIVETPEPLVP